MENAKIKGVLLDDTCGDDKGMGVTLHVDFANGAFIILPLDSKINDPCFTDILMGIYCGKPKTDGERVYWDNGASLTYAELMGLLQSEKKTEFYKAGGGN